MKRYSDDINGFSLIGLFLVTLAISLLVLAGWYIYPKHQKSTSSSGSLNASTRSFNVVGNKIIGPNGKQFIPYGVVIECAAMKKSINDLCNGKDATGNSGTNMIDAASKDWHMNIVRLQVAQEHLFNPDGSLNKPYLSLVDGMVKQANGLGMVAIVTLQEEEFKGPAFPTASATTFWHFMANHYKNSPDVFFDLYNEPRLDSQAAGSANNVWNIWQNGGAAYYSTGEHDVGENKINYVGMQSLVNTIRAQGSNNVVIAEGPSYDTDLTGIPTHQLMGKNIAYGTEPNLRGDPTQSQQYIAFGQYTKKWPIMPEAFLDNYGTHTCDPNSPIDLPQLLNYLKSINMGLIFWSLNSGVGIVGKDLNHPTSYPTGASSISSPYCPLKSRGTKYQESNTIGDGAIIQAFYRANSVQF